MTISIAWVRNAGKTPELVFASDSRLTGGGNVDHCQKVFSLPREDCCISFAGSTTIAYPFILQLINSVQEYKRVMDRAVDVNFLRTRVLSLLNRFIGAHENTVTRDFEDELRLTSFLFGGWSWRASKFIIWRIYFDPRQKKYVAAKTGIWDQFGLPEANAAELAFIGDYPGELFRRIHEKLSSKIEIAKYKFVSPRIDFEPLTVLSEMLTDSEFTDRRRERRGAIGGGPQVTKVYPFLRTMTYAVEWNIGDKFVYILKGRVVSDFELFSVPGINPFTGVVSKPVRGSQEDMNAVAASPQFSTEQRQE